MKKTLKNCTNVSLYQKLFMKIQYNIDCIASITSYVNHGSGSVSFIIPFRFVNIQKFLFPSVFTKMVTKSFTKVEWHLIITRGSEKLSGIFKSSDVNLKNQLSFEIQKKRLLKTSRTEKWSLLFKKCSCKKLFLDLFIAASLSCFWR